MRTPRRSVLERRLLWLWWVQGCRSAAPVWAAPPQALPMAAPPSAPSPCSLQEGGEPLVRVLSVPQGCSPGDVIHLEGGTPGADFPKECKSKFW